MESPGWVRRVHSRRRRCWVVTSEAEVRARGRRVRMVRRRRIVGVGPWGWRVSQLKIEMWGG